MKLLLVVLLFGAVAEAVTCSSNSTHLRLYFGGLSVDPSGDVIETCNAVFTLTQNSTGRPFLFGSCLFAGGDSILLPLDDYEPDQTGVIYKVTYTPQLAYGISILINDTEESSAFECVASDQEVPRVARASLTGEGIAVYFTEPVTECSGFSGFSAPDNITLYNGGESVPSGSLTSHLSGLVWTLSGGNATSLMIIGQYCDAAGNALVGANVTIASSIGSVFVNSPRIYDTGRDGVADLMTVSPRMPVRNMLTSVDLYNLVGDTQLISDCTNYSSSAVQVCDPPSLFSYGVAYSAVHSSGTIESGFSPFAVFSSSSDRVEILNRVRPVVKSVQSNVGSEYVYVEFSAVSNETLPGIQTVRFYDPQGELFVIATLDEQPFSITLRLSAPLSVHRFNSRPIYVSANPGYLTGFLPWSPQWHPVALTFSTALESIVPDSAVLYAGLRLDVSFPSKVHVSALGVTGLNMTCPISSPVVFGTSVLRFDVSNCTGITTGLFLDAIEGAILLGSSFRLEGFTAFPVQYREFYPIYPQKAYLYDQRALALWYESLYTINLTSLNTSAISLSCGSLSSFAVPVSHVLTAVVTGCTADEEAELIVHDLLFRVDSVTAAGATSDVPVEHLESLALGATSQCFPTFNTSLFQVTLPASSDWMPSGNATVNCSAQLARVMLKQDKDMFCAMDLEHSGHACTLNFSVYSTLTFTNQTVSVNASSCSYRGPTIESAHVHGNSTLSMRMRTLSAITQESVSLFKFGLSCDGEEAVLGSDIKVLEQGTVVEFQILQGCDGMDNTSTAIISVQENALETVQFETNLDPEPSFLASQAADMEIATSTCSNYLHQLSISSVFDWSLMHVDDPDECLNTTAYTSEAVMLTLKSSSCRVTVKTKEGEYSHMRDMTVMLSNKDCSLDVPETAITDLSGGLWPLFIVSLILLLFVLLSFLIRWILQICGAIDKKIEARR